MAPLIACHACDLLYQRLPSQEKGIARCDRCGTILYQQKKESVNRSLALSVTAGLLFLIANYFPFIALRIESQTLEITFLSGIFELYRQGMPGLSFLVLLTTWIFPLLCIIGLHYVLLPIKLGLSPPFLMIVFRYISHFQPWGMMEVFMIGILVAMIKLAKMAQIIPGISIYAFAALIFALAGISFTLDPHDVWNRWSPPK